MKKWYHVIVVIRVRGHCDACPNAQGYRLGCAVDRPAPAVIPTFSEKIVGPRHPIHADHEFAQTCVDKALHSLPREEQSVCYDARRNIEVRGMLDHLFKVGA